MQWNQVPSSREFPRTAVREKHTDTSRDFKDIEISICWREMYKNRGLCWREMYKNRGLFMNLVSLRLRCTVPIE